MHVCTHRIRIIIRSETWFPPGSRASTHSEYINLYGCSMRPRGTDPNALGMVLVHTKFDGLSVKREILVFVLNVYFIFFRHYFCRAYDTQRIHKVGHMRDVCGRGERRVRGTRMRWLKAGRENKENRRYTVSRSSCTHRRSKRAMMITMLIM